MKMLSKIRTLVLAISLIAIAGSLVVVANVFANKYTHNLAGCLAASGHSEINSVNRYACPKAAASNQNICATWLSAPGNSTSTEVTASGNDDTVALSFYGMCTDRADTTSNLWLENDGGSISGYSTNFSRSGNWGSPSSQSATLSVSAFIAGLSPKIEGGYRVYTRSIIVWRSHSDGKSQDIDYTIIKLKIPCTEEDCKEPEPVDDICDDWGAPAGYSGADESGGVTSIDIRVKNLAARFGGVGFGDWNNGTIYATPQDDITWHTCYWPGVQATANTQVSSVNGGNWGNYKPLSTTTCQNESVTYKKLKDVTSWENSFEITGDGRVSNNGSYGGAIGSTKIIQVDNALSAAPSNAGGVFAENVKTGVPISAYIKSSDPTHEIWSTPPKIEYDDPDDEDGDGDREPKAVPDCTNKYYGSLKDATVVDGPATDAATVIVPYNFENSTDASLGPDILYSGETEFTATASVDTFGRANSKSMDDYATIVPNGQVTLYAYVVDKEMGPEEMTGDTGNICSLFEGKTFENNKVHQCVELANASTTFNGDGSPWGTGDNPYTLTKTAYSPDASAGDYLCVVSAVFPDMTHSDDITDNSWPGSVWRYSAPKCSVIAKRPTFQVWGADMYSNANIEASIAKKKNLHYKGWELNPSSTVGTTDFSSWVEEGLVLGGNTGSTSTLASGAATGYSGSKPYAGTSGKSFASDLSPLTIANYSGTSWSVGSSGITLGLNDTARRELIDYWIEASSGGGDTASGAKIEYYNSNMINGATIPIRTTRIYDVNGTATITGDIVYQGHEGASGYKTLRDIPKMIIYADNVYISCDVTKVDAILITKVGGTVNTCSDAGGGDGDSSRGNPLKIFGMVITDKIFLGRTYGQAAWNGDDNNKEPERAAAEVFDFDSSILLWSEFMASSAETDTLQMVYQNEIAPRY